MSYTEVARLKDEVARLKRQLQFANDLVSVAEVRRTKIVQALTEHINDCEEWYDSSKEDLRRTLRNIVHRSHITLQELDRVAPSKKSRVLPPSEDEELIADLSVALRRTQTEQGTRLGAIFSDTTIYRIVMSLVEEGDLFSRLITRHTQALENALAYTCNKIRSYRNGLSDDAEVRAIIDDIEAELLKLDR